MYADEARRRDFHRVGSQGACKSEGGKDAQR